MNRLDNTIRLFLERAEYSDAYGEYDIVEVTQDDHHRYERVSGITYEVGVGEHEILGIDEIEATPENTFYENQIESYVKYLDDDGILESFPVQKHETEYTRRDVIEKLDEDFDWSYDWLQEFGIDFDPVDLMNEFDSAFITNYYKLINTLNIKDYSPDDVDPDEEPFGLEKLQRVQKLLDAMDKYISEETDIEYTLTDMNHRFEAAKRVGVTNVLVEFV